MATGFLLRRHMAIGSLWNIILLLRTTSVKNMVRLRCDSVFNTMSGFSVNSVWNFLAKREFTQLFCEIKVSLFSEAPLAGIPVKNHLLCPLEDICCRCAGIPCLVVCKKDGALVTKEGHSGVTGMVIVISAS